MVLQSDAFNRSRIGTVVVAAVTSKLKYETLPGCVRLYKGESGISKASVVNLSQIHAIDCEYVSSRIGSLSSEKMEQVKAGAKLVLGLE